jgi:hypothetical protein
MVQHIRDVREISLDERVEVKQTNIYIYIKE